MNVFEGMWSNTWFLEPVCSIQPTNHYIVSTCMILQSLLTLALNPSLSSLYYTVLNPILLRRSKLTGSTYSTIVITGVRGD